MNLGYDGSDFVQALKALRQRGIRCVPIFWIARETYDMMMETARALSLLDIQGIKMHLLHVMRETNLALMYERGEFELLTQDEYVSLVVDILEILPPPVVIHRVTGDSPREALIGPEWSLRKWEVLNGIDKELLRRDTWQGKLFNG